VRSVLDGLLTLTVTVTCAVIVTHKAAINAVEMIRFMIILISLVHKSNDFQIVFYLF
jgi:hypothetical protein